MAKKKKRAESEAESRDFKEVGAPSDVVNGDGQELSLEKKKKKKNKKNKSEKVELHSQEVPTVSIALPGSIIDNAQSLELATRLAGQIARAVTIFRIDEVVVFDNNGNDPSTRTPHNHNDEDDDSGTTFLIRILQYLETPQYLRKALFPMHNSLRFVGMLPPLDAPHHLRRHEWASYREGVTLKGRPQTSSGTLVDVGLSKNFVINEVIEPGTRITVAMGTERNVDSELPRQIVSSSKPREDARMYWGYKVRYASCLSSVLKECPYVGGYDHLIGTSEHGSITRSSDLTIPTFRHLLIAFGGLAGLEECIEEDSNLKGKDVREVFHKYLNTCPHQGSRTIRTEEALLISLQYFQEPISRAQNVVEEGT